MEFTTHLELHSQTTRLVRDAPDTAGSKPQNGTLTLHGHRLPTDFDSARDWVTPLDPTPGCSAGSNPYEDELFPLHSPLLGESWLVSFPPLSNMLKFGGWACLMGGVLNEDARSAAVS